MKCFDSGWLLFLILAFNAADAIWTLRQIARTGPPTPSGPPAAAAAISRAVQAPIPKVSGSLIGARYEKLTGRSALSSSFPQMQPPVTPRVATRSFKYPPSPSSTPVLNLPTPPELGISEFDPSYDTSFSSPSPSVRAALSLSRSRKGFSESHPLPPPIRWGSPSASLALSRAQKEDEWLEDASSTLASSLLGRSSPRVGKALDAQTLHRLTS